MVGAVAIAVVAGSAAGVVGVQAVSASGSSLTELRDTQVRLVQGAGELQSGIKGAVMYNTALTLGPEVNPTAAQDRDAEIAAADSALTEIQGLDLSDAQQPIVDEVATQWDVVREIVQSDLSTTPVSEIAAITDRYKEANVALTAALDSLLTDSYATIDADIADASTTATRTTVVIVVLLALGAVVSLGLGLALGRMVRRRLAAVGEVVDAIAARDLTRSAALRGSDELVRLGASLDVAQQAVRETLSGVVGSSDSVTSSVQLLAGASAQVGSSSEESSSQAGVAAAAAEQVSRNVQAVAAGAEQMGASIREIAQNANEAAKVAAQATEVAGSANDTVAQLGTSSTEIGILI
jgi:methyl-accepting chemotaxis protein